jgi:hypothetical protein
MLTDDQKEMLHNMGGLSYPLESIVSVLAPSDPSQFRKDFYDPNSEVAMIYKRGADHGQYILDTKLFALAKDGDLKAMKELEIRKRKLANIR